MSKADTKLLDPLSDRFSHSGDGRLASPLPAWRSFASWAGDSSEVSAESGVSIRVSPSWYTPRWSRLEALSIDTRDVRSDEDEGGDASPRSRWTAIFKTNHLVASVTH